MSVQSSPFHFLRVALLTTALTVAAPAAHAALSEGVLSHARSAFTFAERHDWDNALAHAASSHDKALQKLMTWQFLLDVDSGATFGEITRFIRANPDWPDQKKLCTRAEMTMRDIKPSDSDVIAWFNEHPPVTGFGKTALAEAVAGSANPSKEKIDYLLRDAWRNGDFDEKGEMVFLAAHGSVLTAEDDFTRIDRLLWEEKVDAAERMLERVPSAQRKMFEARIALQNSKGVGTALAVVPSEYKENAGLLYDRVRFRVQQGENDDARDLLMHMPAHLPYPEKWWKLREAQVRRAIDEGKYDQAQKLLDGYEQLSGNELADASWLKGWLSLDFLKKPAEARTAFQSMYENVKFPVSKSRAGYWAARAASASGDEQGAKTWYANAAAFPTTFYGQMAAFKLSGKAPLVMPQAPAISTAEKKKFENSDMARAVEIASELNQNALATKLLALTIDGTDDDKIIVAAAGFAKDLGKPNLSVRVAKKAMQQNIILVDAGYPRPKIPEDLAVEDALALAISRQESEFDPQAKSRAGAVGMMQLLPGTAKEIAKKADVGFKRLRLVEAGYNMTLGSHYLARLINGYDGSYIMGIAAYNAGPGNVRNWKAEFGAPDKSVDGAVDWIEKIPFYETRNYVQRVLENLQIYRQLEAGSKDQPLMIGEDLLR